VKDGETAVGIRFGSIQPGCIPAASSPQFHRFLTAPPLLPHRLPTTFPLSLRRLFFRRRLRDTMRHGELHSVFARHCIGNHVVAVQDFAVEDLHRERVLD
jgi:hypothetical protein